MGISFSGVLDENERQGNVNVVYELYSLERKVCHKLEEQASKLYIKALHVYDECLPIVCAVGKKQKILLKVDSVSTDEVGTKVNEILHGDYLEELIKLLAEKLNSTLGTTTAGEEGNLYTHVAFANESVLRIDLFVYHRRFRLTESLSKYNNILAYFLLASWIGGYHQSLTTGYDLRIDKSHTPWQIASKAHSETESRGTSSSHSYHK